MTSANVDDEINGNQYHSVKRDVKLLNGEKIKNCDIKFPQVKLKNNLRWFTSQGGTEGLKNIVNWSFIFLNEYQRWTYSIFNSYK